MAEAPDQPGSGTSFVRDIVSDPNNVPEVILVYGYLGASSEADHERLYLSTDLANYVEIPSSAILHRLAAPQEQDPHGGVTLWVRKDAKLIYKMALAVQALAHYFTGQIQARAALASAPQPTPPAAAPDLGAGPPGPIALGNSPFIRSCIWCVRSVHFDCTLAAVDARQGAVAAIGNSQFIRSCVDTNCIRTHLICTM
jgi:hypothetical protein